MKDTGFDKILIFFTLFFSLIFNGCLSDSDGETVASDNYPVKDYNLDQIDTYLKKGEPLKAIESIFYYEWSKSPDREEISRLYSVALEQLEKDFYIFVENKDFRTALLYMKSVKVLGEERRIKEWNTITLQERYLSVLLENSQYGAASAFLQGYCDLSQFSDDILIKLLKGFIPSQNRVVIITLSNELSRRGRNVGNLVPAEYIQKPDIDDLINGTVTIWVDKGIRLEKGMGIPDIVIGSGFFIDPSGYILTNYHVIESEVNPEYTGYSKLFIRLSEESREKIPARVIGWDRVLDLALVKVEITPPYVFSFSNDDNVKMGQMIYAIGSPAGLMRTVTSGSISSSTRQITPIGTTLQVDVPINPGNSGGPLLNQSGEVIGVIFAGIEQFEGINFAIPGYYAKVMIPKLYNEGPVEHPWLGLAVQNELFDWIVVYVTPGSPAEKAGIKNGDILKKIDDQSVQNLVKMQNYIVQMDNSTIVRLDWTRNGVEMNGFASLSKRPDYPFKVLINNDNPENLFGAMFGFEAEKIGNRRKQFRITHVYPGTFADESGFSAGDLITVRGGKIDKEYDVYYLEALYEGKKGGFLESSLILYTFLDSNVFI